ncbi:hypothetical protein [Streptomyces blastmyceticus]|uniref:hypothetical protein n=1 Tax=Streptomyces blastmyceticus TaxID=68180 RepID=UPI0031CE6A85
MPCSCFGKGRAFSPCSGSSAARRPLHRHLQLVPALAHIGVTATVYAHVRPRLQRDAIDLLGHALRNPAEITGEPDDGDEPPLTGVAVR